MPSGSAARGLLSLYDQLERKLADYDVLLNYTGINLHPRLVERLPAFTVFQCFDDPESSLHLSKPVAAAYDLSLVGNIAELDTYRGWGVEQVAWTALGLWPDTYKRSLTETGILEGHREIDLLMLADRTSRPRRSRINRLADAFPNGHFYGRGWPRGYLPPGHDLACLSQAKIGPNLHNSTGPINLRTFCLPANGVLQICDNRSHLGKIFDLDREVVGFETVGECIDLCRYYLAHDRERREIAAAGWRRVMRDYTEEAVFARKLQIIEETKRSRCERHRESAIARQQLQKTAVRRRVHAAQTAVTAPLWVAAKSIRKLLRPVKRYILR